MLVDKHFKNHVELTHTRTRDSITSQSFRTKPAHKPFGDKLPRKNRNSNSNMMRGLIFASQELMT